MVDQRPAGIVEERLVVLGGDLRREGVVVVRRQAHQRQDLAGLRVHGDDDAALEVGRIDSPLQGLLGEFLLAGIDCQLDARAGLRIANRLEHLNATAGGIALDVLRAVRPAEMTLVGGFHAGLADPIVGQISGRAQLSELLGTDRTGVSEDLGEQRSHRILAMDLHDDLNPGQVRLLLRDEAGRRLRDPGQDPDEVEGRSGIRVDGGIDVRGRHPEQPREPVDDARTLRDRKVGGSKLDRPRRNVGDEGPAGPVVDQATCRRQRLRNDPIGVGARWRLGALDELEVGEPDRLDSEPGAGKAGKREEPEG